MEGISGHCKAMLQSVDPDDDLVIFASQHGTGNCIYMPDTEGVFAFPLALYVPRHKRAAGILLQLYIVGFFFFVLPSSVLSPFIFYSLCRSLLTCMVALFMCVFNCFNVYCRREVVQGPPMGGQCFSPQPLCWSKLADTAGHRLRAPAAQRCRAVSARCSSSHLIFMLTRAD